MPTASYYRAQARILFSISLTTSDARAAERYRTQAEDYLRLSQQAAPNDLNQSFTQAVDAFNEAQLRKH
jgi:hypothetical protein